MKFSHSESGHHFLLFFAHFVCVYVCVVLCVLAGSVEGWTPSLKYAKQALYPWAVFPAQYIMFSTCTF